MDLNRRTFLAGSGLLATSSLVAQTSQIQLFPFTEAHQAFLNVRTGYLLNAPLSPLQRIQRAWAVQMLRDYLQQQGFHAAMDAVIRKYPQVVLNILPSIPTTYAQSLKQVYGSYRFSYFGRNYHLNLLDQGVQALFAAPSTSDHSRLDLLNFWHTYGTYNMFTLLHDLIFYESGQQAMLAKNRVENRVEFRNVQQCTVTLQFPFQSGCGSAQAVGTQLKAMGSGLSVLGLVYAAASQIGNVASQFAPYLPAAGLLADVVCPMCLPISLGLGILAAGSTFAGTLLEGGGSDKTLCLDEANDD